MKKNPKTQKRVFKKKFAKIMACAIAGIGTAGLLSGCSEGVSPVWGTGTDVPETGVIGEMFYDTDDNKLYQYDGEKWEFITELKGDDGGIGPNGFDGASVEVRFVEAENKYEWRYTAGTDEDKSWKDLVDLDDLEGEDAKNIRIKKGETHIVWGYGETDDDVTAWNNLVDLELLKVKGDDGKSAQLQVVGNKLQVNNNDGEGWKDVFDLNTLKGQDGRGIEINFDDETNVYEWRYTSGTDTAWKTLVDLDELVGVAGESVELQVEDDYIQWKQTNGEWQNLIAVADLKVKGDTGATGATIQSVRTNKLDKWGIRSELVLVLNDENETEVKSSELVEVIDNLFYTATSDAEIRQLMAYGVEHIKLGADVEIDAQTNGAFIPEHDVEFDLNGYTFSYPVEVSSERMVIEKGVVVEFRDGNMDFGAAAPNSGSIIINTKSTIVLDNVNYHSDGTALFPRGDTALVRVTNSVVVGQNYGIATNASLDPVTKLPIYAGIEVIVDDSEIRAEAEDYDGTALLFNVPGTLFVNDSEIVADRHAAVIRGGDAKLVDTKLVCTGDYEEVEEIETGGTGNAVPSAVLVVGNEGNGYKWPTSLELDGVKTVAKRFKTPELIVASNEEEEFATNLVLVNHNFTRRQLETAEFSENAKITIILDSIQPVFDIVDMYGYYAVMGDSMQFVL
ncbi:MAG: hypothetical protein IJW24_00495, partial [Clostridia bacterium]|nr:hypothetical protein [Clostridia bacterium]